MPARKQIITKPAGMYIYMSNITSAINEIGLLVNAKLLYDPNAGGYTVNIHKLKLVTEPVR